MRSEDVEELRQLEESMWQAATRFDHTYLERVLHPEFFEFGRSGRVWTRTTTLTAEAAEIEAMLPLPDLAVHPLGDNAALLTYVSLVRHDASWDRSNRSSVWVRDNGKWLLRFHQGTPAQA